MRQGIVKWFSADRGYGFIAPASAEPVKTGTHSVPEPGRDVFVHFSAIEMAGYRVLLPAQPVAYETGCRQDGRTLAVRVIVQE